MRQSPKQNRARSKNGRKSSGPSINRVYESSGPEGKVRGTPQQIIEKYLSLARDKATSGDRVMSESFLQHAEHYVRILGAAQPVNSGAQRREEPEQLDNEAADSEVETDAAERSESGAAPAMAVIGDGEGDGPSDIVDTPEHGAADRRSSRRRSASEGGEEGEEGPRRRRRAPRRSTRAAAAEDSPAAEGAEGEAVEAAPRRGRRTAAAKAEVEDAVSGNVEEIGGASS
ncbi:MAG: DUF4167 domain-containing protein [Neomegalonema sp.]|nr:DUF4167 domain-containing protein [Neomegalonema sp.]